MKLRAIIADDEPLARERLRFLLADDADIEMADGGRFDVADVVRTHDVESSGFARDHPSAFVLSEHERTEAVAVAHAEQMRFVHEDQ